MSSNSGASKNPVKAAFRLVQKIWDQDVTVTAYNSHDEPVKFRFRYLEIVGNGTFGIVCKAIDLDTNETVAIKTVFQDEGHQNRELSIIKALNHPNIVSLKRYYYTRNEFDEEFLSLVLEFVPSSLDKILKEQEKTQIHLSHSFIQFLQALKYLHSLGICHRDIKPHNLLVDVEKEVVKLCDFGCSKRLIEGEPNIQYICARYYRAPEIVFGWAHYTCAIDIWSAGCVMSEMITGKPIFPGKSSVDQLAKIVKLLGSPSPDELKAMGQPLRKSQVSNSPPMMDRREQLKEYLGSYDPPAAAIDLLFEMLTYDPKKRITAKIALEHEYFAPYLRTRKSP